jgi:hypothetical protein
MIVLKLESENTEICELVLMEVVLPCVENAVFFIMGLKRFDRVTSIEMDSPAM